MVFYFPFVSAVKLVLESTSQQVKNNLISRGVKILSCYRKHCATNSAAGQLILADSLKLFPLYINCLLKSDAIGGGNLFFPYFFMKSLCNIIYKLFKIYVTKMLITLPVVPWLTTVISSIVIQGTFSHKI